MNISQKLRVGAAAVVMIAACSDQGSGPVAPVARATTPFGVGAGNPADQGKITIVRTTEVRAPDQSGVAGGAPPRMLRRQQTISMGTGRLTLRREDARMQAALKAKVRTQPASLEDTSIVGLTVPARATSFRKAVAPWRRTTPIAGEFGLVIESEGTGDAPASIIRLVKNGVTTMVVKQEWELWKRQWNLVRRDASTPDDSFHDVVEVTRTTGAGGALESPREWAGGSVRLGTIPPSYDLYDDEEGCDSCKNLRDAEEAALETMLLRALGTAAACTFAPTGAAVPACIAAWLLYTDSLLKWDSAVDKLRDCEADPPPCPKKNPPITDCSRRTTGVQSLAASFACDGATDGGVTGGGGGTTGSSGHYECTYYYEYDLDTGDVIFSQLLYCSWVDGA